MEKLWIQNNETDRKMMLIRASEEHKGNLLYNSAHRFTMETETGHPLPFFDKD